MREPRAGEIPRRPRVWAAEGRSRFLPLPAGADARAGAAPDLQLLTLATTETRAQTQSADRSSAKGLPTFVAHALERVVQTMTQSASAVS
jgi:hypothetical protein